MERKLLQFVCACAGLVLVGFGLFGVFFGASFMDLTGNMAMDSYVRFLKGMLLAIGLVYWSSIPNIERHGERISLVTFILVLGAVPRLMAVIGHGVPTIGILVQPGRRAGRCTAVVAVAAPCRPGGSARRPDVMARDAMF